MKAEPPVVLRSPVGPPRFNGGGTGETMSALWELAGTYSNSQSQKAAALWAKFRTALSKQPTQTVARMVDTKEVTSTLTALDHDRMRGTLAYALFVEGDDQSAVEWAEKSVARSGDRMSMALWAGGLAHWRQGRYDEARDWFARLARSSDSSPWLTAGGAFWASRAALRTGRPEEVSYWLNEAAKEARTFYGLTARRALGLPLSFAWEGDFLSAADSEALGRTQAGRRALALAQLGRVDNAEEELRRLYAVVDERTKDAIVRMADVSGMASFALGLASYRSRTDQGSVSVTDAARYPVPLWEPEDGWRLDRSLLYAFMRQESAFNPDARSVAGAQGLMQMMPATARLVASWDGNANGWLTGSKTVMVPEVNMSLGQKYLETLLAQPEVDGNLFFAAAAYNAGPGNLAKWQKRVQYNDDPLLFIEAIPSRENPSVYRAGWSPICGSMRTGLVSLPRRWIMLQAGRGRAMSPWSRAPGLRRSANPGDDGGALSGPRITARRSREGPSVLMGRVYHVPSRRRRSVSAGQHCNPDSVRYPDSGDRYLRSGRLSIV